MMRQFCICFFKVIIFNKNWNYLFLEVYFRVFFVDVYYVFECICYLFGYVFYIVI